MLGTTGTFTSCKDYDDDINNLQEQINSNKDAIAALQKLVGEGKWVTSITPIENGFTVTMSDGTTQNVTGINGKDGKDGTEWSIGEDGYWYMDGEKTEHYALGTKGEDGEDGKPGVTAPAPYINESGYWVVYELDETTGEFVAKTTEVSAQGTSAYVVEKDGVYILHIANESGEFQDITLLASTDSYIRLAAGYVENGILQITGTPGATTVTYDLNDALVLNGVKVIDFEDLDYDKEENDPASVASYNWITDASNGILTVNKWYTKDDKNPWYAAKYNQLYTTRNLRANIYFFGNRMNKATFDFQATVKSTIYSAEPTSVITIDGTKLVSNYGGDAIDVKAAITKAIYAAGTKKGQTYSLFQVAGGTTQKDVTDYNAPKNDGTYVVNSSSLPIEIEKTDLTKFGMTTADYVNLGANEKYYLQMNDQNGVGASQNSNLIGWNTIAAAVVGIIYDYDNGTWKQIKKDADLSETEATYKELFNKYSALIAFGTKKVSVTTQTAERSADLVGDPTLAFVDKNEAAKYVETNTLVNFEVKPLKESDLTVDPKEVEIPMYLIVKDNWGMTMKVPFNLTIKTTK